LQVPVLSSNGTRRDLPTDMTKNRVSAADMALHASQDPHIRAVVCFVCNYARLCEDASAVRVPKPSAQI
jgi:hypothetical protein